MMGLVEGVATGASRTITNMLDKREEEASAARKYMQQRRIQQAERYETESREMEDLVKGFADVTGGDLDKAAQLIKGAGGIERAGARLDMLRGERLKNDNFDINKMYTFAESQTGSTDPRTVSDYAFNLVQMPKSIDIPESKKFGLGLIDKFAPKPEKISTPEITGTRFDIGTATMLAGTTTTAEEYSKEQELTDLAIQKAQADIAKIQGEVGKEDALTNAAYRSNIALIESNNAQGLPTKIVDGQEVIDYKTAEQQNIDLSNTQTEIVKQATKFGLGAKGTLSDTSNLNTLIAKASAKNKKGEFIVNVVEEEVMPQDYEIGVVYKMKNNETGAVRPHLYLGNGIAPVPLY